MKILAIYGAGGLGREVLDLVRTVNDVTSVWNEIVFIDDSPNETDKKVVNGASVYTLDELADKYASQDIEAVVAIGEPVVRAFLAQKLTDKGFELKTVVHPAAQIGYGTELGEGAIISANAYVTCNVKIGKNVLLQPFATVGHDSAVGDHSVISTFCSLAGHVTVGEKTYIGMGVPVKEGTTIGSTSIVGMGSVVLRDVPDNVRALGNPARAMKENVSQRVFS
jgi:sugar O-acyltransferase (sialic acid O-acetyltransferase NeuD family)